MFKELGQMASMLKNLPKMREEMDRLQQRLGQITAEGTAGAGMVTVRVNGKMEVVNYRLGDDALKDREMLEDLLRAATNQAMQRVRLLVAEETQKMASGLGMPVNMSLPGSETL